MKTFWICSSNAAAALGLVVLADRTTPDGLWPLIEIVAVVALIIGSVLELRHSRWAARWNVGLLVVIVAATLINATLVPMMLHSSDYSEGSAVTFVLFGAPALVLAAVDIVLYRRARQVGAT